MYHPMVKGVDLIDKKNNKIHINLLNNCPFINNWSYNNVKKSSSETSEK